ncbi:MAG: hypothetical protein ACJ75J_09900 [Cytophagaceae bacterium]
MNPIKKCKHCGEWSEWTGGVDELCRNCNHLLDEEAAKASHAREAIQVKVKKTQEKSFFKIKASDTIVMVAIRRVAWLGYMVYISVMGFLIWLAASIAG